MGLLLNRRAALVSGVLLFASTATIGAAKSASLMMFAQPVNTWVYVNSLGRTDMTRAAMTTSFAPAVSGQPSSPNRSVFSPTLAPPYSGWGEINPVIAVYPRAPYVQTATPTP